MKKINIAGVPEHFNLPWRLAIDSGEFKTKGIDLDWTDVPEGTGKLCQMLREGATDLAVILTEGIVKDIIGGNPSKIVQVYVESPLLWGIHVEAKSPYKTIADLDGRIAAISRPGSGSQLMAYVNAAANRFKQDLRFEIVHTLDGALTALQQGKADYLMWEHFMTKPLVDNGSFRRVGDCPTPWPCFVIAVRNAVLTSDPESIRTVLDTINRTTREFREIPSIDRTLAESFGQKIEDIEQWLSITEWSQQPLKPEMLNKVQKQLLELGIVDKLGKFEEIVSR